ncbi:hypothetical protein [Streptomyces nigrescens]
MQCQTGSPPSLVELRPLAGKETLETIGPPDGLWQCGQLQVLRG